MQDLAEALNLLERPLREAVVLHYLGGLAENRMARVLNRPAADIAARIARGEQRLARYLSEFHASGGAIHPCDVRRLLAQFEAGLDTQWICEVRDCAIDYLAQCDMVEPAGGRSDGV